MAVGTGVSHRTVLVITSTWLNIDDNEVDLTQELQIMRPRSSRPLQALLKLILFALFATIALSLIAL